MFNKIELWISPGLFFSPPNLYIIEEYDTETETHFSVVNRRNSTMKNLKAPLELICSWTLAEDLEMTDYEFTTVFGFCDIQD